MSSFEPPVPDLQKMLSSWEEWERGDEMPGRTLAHLKTAGFLDVLRELIETGWQPKA